MEKILDVIREYAVSSGLKLLFALILIVVGFAVVNRLSRFMKRGKTLKGIDLGAQTFIASFVSIALKVVIILTALGILGVPMSNMVAILGSAGLALGLALQGSLSNFAGGLMILIFKPFKVGDHVETKEGTGIVEKITTLYTYIKTFDNLSIIVPNGTLSNSAIVNYSTEPTRRVDISLRVSYTSDMTKIRNTLLRIAADNPLVLREPAPQVYVLGFDEGTVNVALRAWAKTEEYFSAFSVLTDAIKNELADIDIPKPQIEVNIKESRGNN
ncbi:MAG TPA: mechanosensitive ion channel family protein [Clostridiales bacterium]|jgi:small conductance mechanosensitive channel|nr:mechanosensitive ion channel family protein [Clostridiales bacterium]